MIEKLGTNSSKQLLYAGVTITEMHQLLTCDTMPKRSPLNAMPE